MDDTAFTSSFLGQVQRDEQGNFRVGDRSVSLNETVNSELPTFMFSPASHRQNRTARFSGIGSRLMHQQNPRLSFAAADTPGSQRWQGSQNVSFGAGNNSSMNISMQPPSAVKASYNATQPSYVSQHASMEAEPIDEQALSGELYSLACEHLRAAAENGQPVSSEVLLDASVTAQDIAGGGVAIASGNDLADTLRQIDIWDLVRLTAVDGLATTCGRAASQRQNLAGSMSGISMLDQADQTWLTAIREFRARTSALHVDESSLTFQGQELPRETGQITHDLIRALVDPNTGDPELCLMMRALHWLEMVARRQDDRKTTSMGYTDTAGGDQFEALEMLSSNVRSSHDIAAAGVTPFGSTPFVTRSKSSQADAGGQELDPDGPFRNGVGFHMEDEMASEAVMCGVWAALRRGDCRWAQSLCRLHKEPWRAAALSPIGVFFTAENWSPPLQGFAEGHSGPLDPVSGYSESTTAPVLNDSGDIGADGIGDGDFGITLPALAKCLESFEYLSKQSSRLNRKWESGVFGIFSASELDAAYRCCQSFQDYLWVSLRSSCMTRLMTRLCMSDHEPSFVPVEGSLQWAIDNAKLKYMSGASNNSIDFWDEVVCCLLGGKMGSLLSLFGAHMSRSCTAAQKTFGCHFALFCKLAASHSVVGRSVDSLCIEHADTCIENMLHAIIDTHDVWPYARLAQSQGYAMHDASKFLLPLVCCQGFKGCGLQDEEVQSCQLRCKESYIFWIGKLQTQNRDVANTLVKELDNYSPFVDEITVQLVNATVHSSSVAIAPVLSSLELLRQQGREDEILRSGVIAATDMLRRKSWKDAQEVISFVSMQQPLGQDDLHTALQDCAPGAQEEAGALLAAAQAVPQMALVQTQITQQGALQLPVLADTVEDCCTRMAYVAQLAGAWFHTYEVTLKHYNSREGTECNPASIIAESISQSILVLCSSISEAMPELTTPEIKTQLAKSILLLVDCIGRVSVTRAELQNNGSVQAVVPPKQISAAQLISKQAAEQLLRIASVAVAWQGMSI